MLKGGLNALASNDIHSIHYKGKGKGKVQPITGHEGPDGEQMYSSTLP